MKYKKIKITMLIAFLAILSTVVMYIFMGNPLYREVSKYMATNANRLSTYSESYKIKNIKYRFSNNEYIVYFENDNGLKSVIGITYSSYEDGSMMVSAETYAIDVNKDEYVDLNRR